MILREYGINWTWYYDTDKMVRFRCHNYRDAHPENIDATICRWADKNGTSGIDFKTRLEYPETHCRLDDGRILEINRKDFSMLES